MADADIANILAMVPRPFYDTQVRFCGFLFVLYLTPIQEVIYGAGEAVQPSQYTTTGYVYSKTRRL